MNHDSDGSEVPTVTILLHIFYRKVIESLVSTTFIKTIKLSNDRNQEVHLIDNFCRVEDTKNLVFDFNEMNARFNQAGQGPV